MMESWHKVQIKISTFTTVHNNVTAMLNIASADFQYSKINTQLLTIPHTYLCWWQTLQKPAPETGARKLASVSGASVIQSGAEFFWRQILESDRTCSISRQNLATTWSKYWFVIGQCWMLLLFSFAGVVNFVCIFRLLKLFNLFSLFNMSWTDSQIESLITFYLSVLVSGARNFATGVKNRRQKPTPVFWRRFLECVSWALQWRK